MIKMKHISLEEVKEQLKTQDIKNIYNSSDKPGLITKCLLELGYTPEELITKCDNQILERMFILYEKPFRVNIPNGVTKIGNNAFWFCNHLTAVHIPSSVTTIGAFAFTCCENLENINIPDNVVEIGKWAFHSCEKLTGIYIPNNITKISEATFAYCYNLSNVYIPNNVTEIEEEAFYNCRRLKTINIPESVIKIGKYAFADTGLTEILIPHSVKYLSGKAFAGIADYCSHFKYDGTKAEFEKIVDDIPEFKRHTNNIEYLR